MSEIITIVCECNSALCVKRFEVDANEYDKYLGQHTHFFISADCKTPPEPNDVKFAEGKGYIIYKTEGAECTAKKNSKATAGE
jgi:hypothetical protein